MALLKDICIEVTESKVVEYRYNVILKSQLLGFKMYLETNVNGVSKADVVQKVRRHLNEMKEEFHDVLQHQWNVATVTPIKPSPQAQHVQRMKNKKKG